MRSSNRISVIIMTLNAERYIEKMLDMLKRQTVTPDEVIVVDSESDDNTVSLASRYDFVKIIQIKRYRFDHGGSRDYALRQSIGDFILFLTQDALPMNDQYINELIKPFADDQIAAVCGRHVAYPEASPYEILVRRFNYPVKSNVWSKIDIDHLGVKAYFLSNACSAYRRTAYLAVGGFDAPMPTNEDMMIAAKFIHMGWHLAYAAQAQVNHSHNLTLKQEYTRNILIGRVMEEYRDRLTGANSDREGMRMVLSVSSGLLKEGRVISLVQFSATVLARFLGNRVGKRLYRIKRQL